MKTITTAEFENARYSRADAARLAADPAKNWKAAGGGKRITPCHTCHPLHPAWLARVAELEAEGCDTSDAQSIADLEITETPRQLADERADLLAALKPFVDLEIALYSASGLHAFTDSGMHKIPEEWRHLISAVLFARETVARVEGKPTQSGPSKVFRINDRIGKARYTVSAHDGIRTHEDGSPFFGIEIFRNRKDRDAYVASLRNQGYTEQ